ncbi:L-lactate dehydrogese [Daphnia sinensis]|uniref:L-lactate dehydrogese n=1 Tax=Daphnia sinensis TaxID=1820382 RepID=A0AAD5PU82_9CRUS|nr:L-lactate dehydrogese [Daphnia sinensis]
MDSSIQSSGYFNYKIKRLQMRNKDLPMMQDAFITNPYNIETLYPTTSNRNPIIKDRPSVSYWSLLQQWIKRAAPTMPNEFHFVIHASGKCTNTKWSEVLYSAQGKVEEIFFRKHLTLLHKFGLNRWSGVWSGVDVAGVRLRDLNPAAGLESDTENWNDIHKQVVQSAYEIIRLKGHTSWAMAASVATLTTAILKNTRNVHAVSTSVEGIHGVQHPVFLSVPCVLGESGITDIIQQTLTEDERSQFQKSAATLNEVQSNLVF